MHNVDKFASKHYSLAGGLALQALSSIRTVSAFNMQPYFISEYRKHLFATMQFGVDIGFSIGVWNGALFAFVYLTYALGFWYGAQLVADDIENHCTENCIDGGEVITCFFCIIMGAAGLGQVNELIKNK